MRPDSEQARLGLAVPKKMAPLAVTRNRIKRICRETFRQRQARMIGDIVLVAQARAKPATPDQLRDELTALLSHAGRPDCE